MNRRLALLIAIVWILIATGSLRVVSTAGDFPVNVTALVSNLEAVRSDSLIANHFNLGQNETVLYCLDRPPRTVSGYTGLLSLDNACAASSGALSASEPFQQVSEGYLNKTPISLILEGIDLARSVRSDGSAQSQPSVKSTPPAQPKANDLRRAELWSLALTVLALLVCLRSITAAMMTFGFGVLIVATTWGVLALLSTVITLPFVIVSLASLLALALGADLASQAYIGRLISGRMNKAPALIACAGVVASFIPLVAFPPSGLKALLLSVFVASSVALAGAVTLLPAAFVLLGNRLLRQSLIPRHRSAIALAVIRLSRNHSVSATVVAFALLVPFAVAGYGQLRAPQSVLPVSIATSSTSPNAVLSGDIERMTMGTIEFIVAAPRNPGSINLLSQLVTTIATHPEFAAPVFVQWSADDQIGLVTAFIPDQTSDDALKSARAVVRTSATDSSFETLIGGPTMLGAEVDEILGGWSIWGAAASLVFALMVLIVGFRAVVMVLVMMLGAGLSALAALGILARLIERGVSLGPFRVDAQSGLDPWAPLIVTCVVIATSTSYVSLVMGQQHPDGTSAAYGDSFWRSLANAPQLTTAAAVSLIAIGMGFTTSGVTSLQQAGAGLAIALAIQATLVRMVFTPAILDLIDKLEHRTRSI